MTTSSVGRDRRLALVVTGFLVVAAAVLLGRALLGREALIGADQMLLREPWRAELLPLGASISTAPAGDTFDIWDPQRQLFAEALLDGDLALWNPYPSGGAPLAGEPSTGTFSPFQLVYVALPDWYAPGVVKLLEAAACVGFSFLFLRSVGLGRAAAVTGGAVYAFNGYQLVWTNWPQTRVGALVPALFWAVERVLQRRDRAGVALTAVVVAILFFDGFPTVTMAALIAAGAYVVVRLAATDEVRAVAADVRAAAGRRTAHLRAAAARAGRGVRDLRPTVLHPAALCAAGVALGVGLTAVQLLPFLARLPLLDLSRDQDPDAHFDVLVAATLAAPNAFGAPQDGAFHLPGNYVESLSYVGAVACVLAVVALARRAPAGLTPGVRLHAGLAALVVFVLMYVGGPFLAFAQSFPPLDTNNVGRLRALLAFFVAVLAAIGVEGVLRPGEGGEGGEAGDGTRRPIFLVVVTGALAVAAAGTWHVLSTASDRGYLPTARRELLVAAGIAAVAVAAVVAAHRWRGLAVPAVAVLAVLVVGQGLAVWQPYLPTSDRDEWYPSTAMHRFLQDNLGHERAATAGSALVAGSTARYGIRTVTGHVFTQPTWRDVLSAVDPAAFSRSPTFSYIDATAEVATSPVLDRLGARYFAAGEDAEVLGVRQPPPVPTPTASASGNVELGPGDGARAPLRASRLRAVTVTLTEPLASDDPLAWLRVTVRDAEGTVVARGSRRIHGTLRAGAHEIAVAAESATAVGPTDLSVEISLDAGDGRAALAADAEGRPVLGTVTGDDDLELVLSDHGQVYERSTALPRVRWASEARVEPDRDRRLARLRSGLPDDMVLLDERGPAARDGEATVEVTRDGLDGVTVEVEAERPGYLVLADAVQIGWQARLDGEPVELRHADHALGAVHVPAGRHDVTFEFRPQRMRLGTAVSALSLVLLVGLLAVPALVRRRRSHAQEGDARP